MARHTDPARGSRLRGAIAVGVLACLAALAVPAHAADPRLQSRLGGFTAAAVESVIALARTQGLPTEPLVATALEGAAKRVSSHRIVEAVSRRAAAFAAAKDALGPGSSEAEIVAGAGTLMAGLPADSLRRLRAIQPNQSLVVPLVVLADLIVRDIPAEVASDAVLRASRRGVKDRRLLELRERIDRDIQSGMPPAEALISRMRGMGLDLDREGAQNRARRGPVRPPKESRP